MLRETIVQTLSEIALKDWQPMLLKNQVIVHLPEAESDFLPRYRKAKKEIIDYLSAVQTETAQDIAIEIRSGGWHCSFKVAFAPAAS